MQKETFLECAKESGFNVTLYTTSTKTNTFICDSGILDVYLVFIETSFNSIILWNTFKKSDNCIDDIKILIDFMLFKEEG